MTQQDEAEDIFDQEDETDTGTVEEVLRKGEVEVYTIPADPDVKTLLDRIENKSLVLKPKFQRAKVWDEKKKSRLIESLILNLPIPPCFLAEDEDGTRVVVDGQQRLSAVDDFYHGRYALEDLEVLKDLNGKKWEELPPKMDRKILQRVIRILVISSHTHPDLRFIIFERLNTGATPLLDQEIRNAVLGGSFNDLLEELVNTDLFKEMLKINDLDSRLRHHELILRFFAIKANISNYKPPLKLLLTNHMRIERKAPEARISEMRAEFALGLKNSKEVFGTHAFRKFIPADEKYSNSVSKALFDLQMMSLCQLSPVSVSARKTDIENAFKALSADANFSESLSRATDHRSRFYTRQRKWLGALNSIGIQAPVADQLPTAEE
ncbi:MAG: DUF262 domain-containing protein [Rhodospirillales bacterium]|nr:DUF262 domain-containing protein [Rhodospirillales bacterium]